MVQQQGVQGLPGNFWAETSLHGVKHITDGSQGKRRYFWIGAILLMISLLIVILVQQIIKFTSYPFYTVLTMHQRHVIEFPAVTICNNNQFRNSSMGNDTSLRKLIRARYDNGPLAITVDLDDPSFAGQTTLGDPSDFIKSAAHQSDNMFRFCSWKDEKVNCSEYLKPRQTNYGYCYTFHSKEYIASDGALDVNTPGEKGGLVIMVDIEDHEYYYSLGSSTGIKTWYKPHAAPGIGVTTNTNTLGRPKVLVHEPTSEPNMLLDGFLAGPGTMTYAAVSLTKVKALPPPYMAMGNDYCVDTTSPGFENPLKHYDTYDMRACFMECEASLATEICGCQDVFDKGNASYCSLRTLVQCYDSQRRAIATNATKLSQCGCKRQCAWSEYDVAVSTAGFPLPWEMKQIMVNRNRSEDYIKRNYVAVSVFFQKLVNTEIGQVAAYSIVDVVANLGGQFGIFIGASFLTLTEVVEYMIGLIWTMFPNPRKSAVKAWRSDSKKPEEGSENCEKKTGESKVA